MNRLRVVLLDLDGTLVDAHDAICDGVHQLSVAAGLGSPDRDWLKSFIGRPPHEVWEALGAEDPHGMTERFAAHVMGTLPDRTLVLPGVEQAVAELVGMGLSLAVATTRKTHSADATLQAKGLSTHIPVVVGRDKAGAPKPAPDVILTALEELGADADEALMIGDTEADALAASAAGVRCWGVLGGVGSEQSLRAAGAEHILVNGLGGAPDAIRTRREGTTS
jgi:HAD superfamily hydrolase (TIGR01509 family)